MINTKFTKSVMENEEGMNHLWLQISPISHAGDVRIQITMPSGMYRLNNLSGYEESVVQEIVVPNPLIENNIIVEIFTRSRVVSGEKTIIVAITYNEKDKPIRVEHNVPIIVVSEDEMDCLVIDEAAAAFIKEHLAQQHSDEQHEYEFIDHSQTKVVRIESNEYAEWEKKYRIEGIAQARIHDN
ncbi:hypothetical protein [Bacillus sp. FJAT-28004]|uniref:hypothetical protein n=1 Tax=Bacillus sp. FJAT-28004 TaxID=1679165 RepID=UPI0006B49271|nr:hypothetical protein [Bacillus sp. FJAT-28004]